MVEMSALRFLFLKTLRRNYRRDDLPLPRCRTPCLSY
jgi:hypothetical protein